MHHPPPDNGWDWKLDLDSMSAMRDICLQLIKNNFWIIANSDNQTKEQVRKLHCYVGCWGNFISYVFDSFSGVWFQHRHAIVNQKYTSRMFFERGKKAWHGQFRGAQGVRSHQAEFHVQSYCRLSLASMYRYIQSVHLRSRTHNTSIMVDFN